MKSSMKNNRSILNLIVRCLFLILFVVGIAAAVRLKWSCDDSFISIRYADNLANGLGLVYNANEYVEGYTNLLWTLILAGASKIGISPVPVSQYLGIVFYGLLVLSLAGWTWRRSRERGRLFIPLAAALVLVSNDFHVWASGGLETMMFAYLAVQAFLLLRTSGASPRHHIAAGCFFALLVLTHPDGLVFVVSGILFCAAPYPKYPVRVRFYNALCVLSPVLVTLAVLIPFKLSYYGDLFPTAFYSKSVLDPYFSQGFSYIFLYLKKNWFISAAIVILVITRAIRKQAPASAVEKWDILVFISAAYLFLLYITSVGGDFMFARRILPAIPFIFLVFEEVSVKHKNKYVYAGMSLFFLAGAALPFPIYSDSTIRINGIADERRFYTKDVIEARKMQAEIVHSAVTSPDARVAFAGGMCVFGYYSKLPYLVEASGLTQYSLAKSPLVKRGHIGHEKGASYKWLKENNIHFIIHQDFPKAVMNSYRAKKQFNEIYFADKVEGEILYYSDEVMDCMRENPDVSFTPIEITIEQARSYIEHAPKEKSETLFQILFDYYFRGAGEKGRIETAKLRKIIDNKR